MKVAACTAVIVRSQKRMQNNDHYLTITTKFLSFFNHHVSVVNFFHRRLHNVKCAWRASFHSNSIFSIRPWRVARDLDDPPDNTFSYSFLCVQVKLLQKQRQNFITIVDGCRRCPHAMPPWNHGDGEMCTVQYISRVFRRQYKYCTVVQAE